MLVFPGQHVILGELTGNPLWIALEEAEAIANGDPIHTGGSSSVTMYEWNAAWWPERNIISVPQVLDARKLKPLCFFTALIP